MLTTGFIQQAAQALGFDACGVVALAPTPAPQRQRFEAWLARGYHARMGYLQRFADKRADPRLLLRGGAKTAVVALLSYNTRQRQPPHLPQVARYAYGADYHGVLKQKLWALLAALQREQPALRGRTLADTAPLHERYLAAAAGLGWIGKNGMLVNRLLGSYTYIGTLLLDAEVEGAPPLPAEGGCGACTRCVEACPAQAIVSSAVVNAGRCRSYQTVEAHACEKSRAAESSVSPASAYVFGCDVCQEVCPWNETARVVSHPEVQLLPALQSLTREAWLAMSDDEFAETFAHSAILRATPEGMRRNVRTAYC